MIGYSKGLIDAAGHYIHVGTATVSNSGQHIVILRSTTFDLSNDPEWGNSGSIIYSSASSNSRAGLASQSDGKLLIGGHQNVGSIARPIVLRYHNIPDPRAILDLTMNLGGAYDAVNATMRDDLRQSDLIPWMQPYATPSFGAINGLGSLALPASILTWTGDSAIVDWVWLELLDVDDPSEVKATRVGLLHRNGKVTRSDGLKLVDFSVGAGTFYLRVRHRNHLSVTLAEPLTLGVMPTVVDLTSPATSTFGTDAQKEVDGTMMLWPGNANADGMVKYVGSSNDSDRILVAVGGSIPTAIVTGYYSEDLNMDGIVKYTGMTNDRDLILQTIGGTGPTSVRLEQGP